METTNKKYLELYKNQGEDKFYKYLIFHAISRIAVHGAKSPELELLSLYEVFLILYRRENKSEYMKMAKLFRKAAHKVYRMMLKMDLDRRNAKFLNVVQ